ncbi:Antitermination protein [Pseudomonas putida]|nr:Antitermination protein [Pseudomonas putida]
MGPAQAAQNLRQLLRTAAPHTRMGSPRWSMRVSEGTGRWRRCWPSRQGLHGTGFARDRRQASSHIGRIATKSCAVPVRAGLPAMGPGQAAQNLRLLLRTAAPHTRMGSPRWSMRVSEGTGRWRRCWPSRQGLHGTGFARDRRQASSHVDRIVFKSCAVPVGAGLPAMGPAQAAKTLGLLLRTAAPHTRMGSPRWSMRVSEGTGRWRRCWPSRQGLHGTGYARDRRQASSHVDRIVFKSCAVPVGAGLPAMGPAQAAKTLRLLLRTAAPHTRMGSPRWSMRVSEGTGRWRRCWPSRQGLHGTGFARDRRQASSHIGRIASKSCAVPVRAGLPAMGPGQAAQNLRLLLRTAAPHTRMGSPRWSMRVSEGTGRWRRCWPSRQGLHGTGFARDRRKASSHVDRIVFKSCAVPVGAGLPAMGPAQAAQNLRLLLRTAAPHSSRQCSASPPGSSGSTRGQPPASSGPKHPCGCRSHAAAGS